jgi:uncharacterized metal-binding protein YceD (DUF177 family)
MTDRRKGAAPTDFSGPGGARDRAQAGGAATGGAATGGAAEAGKARWRPTEVTARRGVAVDLAPDDAARSAMARDLGILGIPALRLTGALRPEGARDFRLDGRIAAVVEQACVVTLDPVRTVIDEPVLRRFLAEMPEPEGDEVEMPEDDSAEPLGSIIDLDAVLAEALALALPAYPRSAAAQAAAAREPGSDDDDRQRPFAGLQILLGGGAAKD